MNKQIKNVLIAVMPVVDWMLLPFVFLGALSMKAYRRIGTRRLPASTALLKRVGVYPLRNHYYDPMFDHRNLRHALDDVRNLPGIDFREQAQLELLDRLGFEEEFKRFLDQQVHLPDGPRFTIDNGSPP